MYVFTYYVYKVVSRKIDLSFGLRKKDKIWLKTRHFMVHVLSFYTDHVQYRFFVKLHERIWIMEIYMRNFSFKFFDTSKYIF
jgi:hypothetical protein